MAPLLRGSYAGQIDVIVPYQVRLDSSQAVIQIANAYAKDKIKFENVTSAIAEIQRNISRLKDTRYVVKPVLASRGNLYILGASLVGSAIFDYLINYLEDQKNKYLSALPPSDCQYLVDHPCEYYDVDNCNPTTNGYSIPVYVIVGWRNNGSGGCFPVYELEYYFLPPKKCLSVQVVASVKGTSVLVNIPFFEKGKAPTDYLSCPGQPKKEPPPFVIPPVPLEKARELTPTGDFISSISFSDSELIKTPQDITPPLISSDFSTVYDIPGYSPDGVFSPDFTNPNNPVPDIPLVAPNIQVNYKINNPITSQENHYYDRPSSSPTNTDNHYYDRLSSSPTNTDNTNTDNKVDYTYTSTDRELDINMEVPQKKDIASLIMSNIAELKSRFVFNSSCSGGSCSFAVDVFGRSAVIDFCKFADVFSKIGIVILTFSYFYAFFIIVKGN